MEVEKSHNLPPAAQGPRKASGVMEFEGLKTREASAINPSQSINNIGWEVPA